jgi:thiol-disulfide isomerase/thioredoxin
MCSVLLAGVLAGCRQHTPDGLTDRGQPVFLKDYRGKWLVVNYWATWCAPCITELPALNALHQAAGERVAVLAVSFDQLPQEEIQQFASKLHVQQLPMLQSLSLSKWGIDSMTTLPITFIISPKGQLVETLHGPQTLSALEAAVKQAG